jgi:ADP-ribose pyrophosphatase YjhB (NUDIX family)
MHAGALRLLCPGCGFVHYNDPKVAVAVITGQDGRVLLARRAHDPGMGLWTFPSGFVDRGEALETAAKRETLEETGVQVSIDRLLAVRSGDGHPVVLVAFAGSIVGGIPAPGDEATEVGFFAPHELPELAFPHDRDLIDAWLAGPSAAPAILSAAPGTGPGSH